MHELSVARALVKLALEESSCNSAHRVIRIGVRIGEMTDILPDALRLGYEMATQGTALEQALLCIERVPITVTCGVCREVSPVAHLNFHCLRCESTNVELTSGLELDLCWIELDRGEILPPATRMHDLRPTGEYR